MMFAQFNARQCEKAQGYQSLCIMHVPGLKVTTHERGPPCRHPKQGFGRGPDPNIPLPDLEEFCLQAVVIQHPRPDLGIQSQQ